MIYSASIVIVITIVFVLIVIGSRTPEVEWQR